MIKSLLLNILLIAFILIAYYFDLLNFLTSSVFLWVLFVVIAIIFAVAFKVLGNPFTAKPIQDETDKKE